MYSFICHTCCPGYTGWTIPLAPPTCRLSKFVEAAQLLSDVCFRSFSEVFRSFQKQHISITSVCCCYYHWKQKQQQQQQQPFAKSYKLCKVLHILLITTHFRCLFPMFPKFPKFFRSFRSSSEKSNTTHVAEVSETPSVSTLMLDHTMVQYMT